MKYSGIGGQAVLEGVMMKNKEKYAVAVRKPNGEITVDTKEYYGLIKKQDIAEHSNFTWSVKFCGVFGTWNINAYIFRIFL